MDKVPGRRSLAHTPHKNTSSASKLASPTRQSGAFIPTVSSVVEKFNFGLKEQLKKAEKDNHELQTKYKDLLTSMEFISDENNRLKSSQSVLQEDKKALESKYHKLKSHTDVMKADYDRVNAKLSSLEVANESLKQTSWIRRSKRGKGNSATNAHDGAAAASEISTLKEHLGKKDTRISELEKEVASVQEKLKQAVLENQQSKSIQINVENADAEEEIDIGSRHKIVVDDKVLNSLDKQSVLLEYKKLLADYNKKQLELKDHQDQILNLEKHCTEQRKELVILNMEINKVKGDNSICVLSGSNNALNHSPRSSSVTILGVPSSFVKSASFDNGRRVSLPAHRGAASSPDVSVLQNCLKLSLAEKKTLEEEIKELKQQLFSLQHEQPSVKSSRSQSVISSIPSPSNSTPKSPRSLSTSVSPKMTDEMASKSLKGDISMLQSCLQLAITEKKTLAEENEALKTSTKELQQKTQSLETQLEKLAPQTEELAKLKASLKSLEKEKNGLLDNEKKLNIKVKSLDAKKTQLMAEKSKLNEEIEKLNQKVAKLNEKGKQQRAVEKHHKAVQTTSERSLDRNRPGSADSKATSRVSFYRSNSQNSDTDVQTDQKKTQVVESLTQDKKVEQKKTQVVESPTQDKKVKHKKLQATESHTPAEHKKIQVAEGQASEMKVACRLNITSHSPSTSPSNERHFKVSHTKSLVSDYTTSKGNRHITDVIDGESSENKFLSSSQPSSFKPAVTSVKVSTSIKKETPTKINTLHLKSSSPQLHSTSHVPPHTTISAHSHTPTVVSRSPTHGSMTAQSSSTRVTTGAVSPGGNVSHSVQLGTSQQSHVTTTSHASPSVTAHSTVTSNPPSSGTTQLTSGTSTHQPLSSVKPRPFYKSNTVMSLVSSSKSTGSPSHSPVVVQKSSVTGIPTTVVTSPPKLNTENHLEAGKPPLQKTNSLTVNSSGSEVVRRRPKSRSQQILDPMKRSSAYYPTDVASLSIMEENELHRCGSLESLKTALFHAASAKVHPSVASSSVSTASNVPPVNTSASSTTSTVTSTSFSSPIPKAVSFSKVQSQEFKPTAEAKKEVKFMNSNQQLLSTRPRPRAARHQSINNPLPPVSSYYLPITPTRYVYLCSIIFVLLPNSSLCI